MTRPNSYGDHGQGDPGDSNHDDRDQGDGDQGDGVHSQDKENAKVMRKVAAKFHQTLSKLLEHQSKDEAPIL